MKLRVTMKDPDGVWESSNAVAEGLVAGMELDDDAREHMEEYFREKTRQELTKWFRYGEYVEIDIDLDAGTATVVKQ